MDHEDRRNQTALADGAFGVIRCPECSTAWTKEFVPEFCTKCGGACQRSAGKVLSGWSDSSKRLARLPRSPYARIVASGIRGGRPLSSACAAGTTCTQKGPHRRSIACGPD